MRNTYFAALWAALLFICCSGCGTTTVSEADLVVPGLVNPAPSTDLDDPFAGLTDDELADGEIRSASGVYTRFFSDSVNQHSQGRWTVADTGGSKSWALINNAYSAPKAWQIGGNYRNGDIDTLTSRVFSIPGGTGQVKLSFWCRWSVGAGDSILVQHSDGGGGWSSLSMFQNGSNPSFPAWDRYTFFLPEDSGDRDMQVRFHFMADGADTGFGIAVDSVAVYQTQLEPPVNLSAIGQSNGAKLLWSHPPSGTRPATYSVERAEAFAGPYSELGTVDFPARQFLDNTAAAGQGYWYRVIAHRDGFSSTPATASIGGGRAFDAGTWTTATIAAANGSHESSVAIVNGNPAIAFKHSDGSLHYLRSSTPDGSDSADWGSSAQIFVGTYPLHAVHMLAPAGSPGIAFFEEGEHDVFAGDDAVARYYSSTDADGAGATWIDRGSIEANYRILDIGADVVDGKPAIGVCHEMDDSLIMPFYDAYWATDAAGTTFNPTDTFSAFGPRHCFLGSIDNLPATLARYYTDTDPENIIEGITFHKSSGTFRYIEDNPAYFPDLATLDAGSTVLNFYAGIHFDRSTDAGESWEGSRPLGFSSISFDARLIDGKPALVYADGGGVWYVSALDADGSTWSLPQLVAAAPAFWPGNESAQWLVEIGGEPAVLWSDSVDIHFSLHQP